MSPVSSINSPDSAKCNDVIYRLAMPKNIELTVEKI